MIYSNILVHSYYRCGTNQFMSILKSGYSNINYHAKYYDELFSEHSNPYISIKDFELLSKSDDLFIIKLMDYDLFRLNENDYKTFLDILIKYNFYVIRIERKNIKELIYSNYIATITGEWSNQSDKKIIANYSDFSKVFKYTIDEYLDRFLGEVRLIPYNQKIIYEDFIKEPKIKIGDIECVFDGSTKPSPPKREKVLNYDEMESWYNELYLNYLKKKEVFI